MWNGGIVRSGCTIVHNGMDGIERSNADIMDPLNVRTFSVGKIMNSWLLSFPSCIWIDIFLT